MQEWEDDGFIAPHAVPTASCEVPAACVLRHVFREGQSPVKV